MTVERDLLNLIAKQCKDYQEAKETYDRKKQSLEEEMEFYPDFGPVRRDYQEILERYQESHEQAVMDEGGLFFRQNRKQEKKMLRDLTHLAKRSGIALDEEEEDLSLRIDRYQSNIENYLDILYAERVTVPLIREKEHLDQVEDLFKRTVELIFPVSDSIVPEKTFMKTNKN